MKDFKKITFPNGEIEIKEKDLTNHETYKFDSKRNLAEQILELKQLDYMMAKKYGAGFYNIECNYLPYGRADKTGFNISILNMFSSDVYFYAPHTKNREIEESLTNKALLDYLYKENTFIKETLIIFPDAGAKNRFRQGIEDKMVNYNYLIKERNLENGDLEFPEQHIANVSRNGSFVEFIPEEIKNIIIVDDIISKGGTMLAAESILRKQFPKAKIKGAVFYDENTKQKDYPLKIDIITEEIFK